MIHIYYSIYIYIWYNICYMYYIYIYDIIYIYIYLIYIYTHYIYKSMKPIALSIAVSWKFDSPTESQVFAAGAQGATVSRLPAV